MDYSIEIKKYRKENCFSQKDLADKLGVKFNTICRWETGKFEPSNKFKKELNNLIGKKDGEIKRKKFLKSPLNYTGNKYRILSQIVPYFPKKINTFVDMFCGGATVGINVDADTVYFIDSNEKVINLLRFLSNVNFKDFVSKLEYYINLFSLSYSNINGYAHYFNLSKPENINNGLKMYNKEGFLKLRNAYNSIENKKSEQANILLYLLLVYGFNNDLRFNSKGEYNLPCGKTDLNKFNLNKVYEFNLKAQQSQFIFLCGDFRDKHIREICYNADFLYLDPPYLLSDAVYNESSGWDIKTEKELIDFLKKCEAKHVTFCLSNVLSKNDGQNIILNEPLNQFILEDTKLHMIDIDYHYRSSSYNKKNRNSKEREIIVLSEGAWYENK